MLYIVFYLNDYEDLFVLIVKVCEMQVKFIYFVNFDNLMGMCQKGVNIIVQFDQIFDGCFLVLDEVYVEFVFEGIEVIYDVEYLKVICMCIFFKGYGMVGVCVGYVMGVKDLIKSFDKICNYFGMNCVSQVVVLVVLVDQDWLFKIC